VSAATSTGRPDSAYSDTGAEANVSGPLFLTQALAPHIRADGRLIFTSTSLTSNPFSIMPGYLPYVASKGAVEQMTRVLSRDPALTGPERRITVNVVSPGPIATELFLKGKPQQVLDQMSGLHPQKRLGQPEDVSAACCDYHDARRANPLASQVAGAVLLLLLPAAGWISGQNLRVNGGMVPV
jgi:3-oxoacyl-[acyl-carrier protein] reductase